MSTTVLSKWRSILGLIIIYLATWFNWLWLWGFLFLLWVIPDIRSGTTFFMEPIEKREHPVLYWIIVLSWLLIGLYYLLFLFYPS